MGSYLSRQIKETIGLCQSLKKEHGKENQIEGELEEGRSVLVIEDLISTGGSSLNACSAIKEASCNVVACLAIFNYQLDASLKNFTQAKIPLYSLSDFNTLLKAATDIKYINAEQKKSLLKWHNAPKKWKA